MKQKHKIINLFNIYTTLSISISLLAWLLVTLGFVNVPEALISKIGPFEMAMGIIVYGLALANVISLYKTNSLNSELFLLYISSQIAILIMSFVQHGWLFFPAAGSQGTIPAIAITIGMYFFLWKKSKKETRLIS